MNKKMHRRDVLRVGAAAGFATGLAPAVLGKAKPKPVRLGVVGVGSRGTHLLRIAPNAGVEVPALCDIKEPNLRRAIDVVKKARGRVPEGYSKGPKDYLRMFDRDDLDAVICGADMQVHAAICIAAMRAGIDWTVRIFALPSTCCSSS